MTRKDYEMIASAMATTNGLCTDESERAAVKLAAEFIANGMASDNPRFDRARFLKACQA